MQTSEEDENDNLGNGQGGWSKTKKKSNIAIEPTGG